ncbi:MAG: DNA repair protein RecN [Treponema sp.]|jgi:DNA repair protein RecN (Recombination protein N)|nr:DNA repair protein RecN [Treponema sp.]
MLEELNVRNYALVDNISVSFEGGLNILTGETGAGKSIIVGALSFLLGARADAEVIRSGNEEATVSAVVSIRDNNRDALDWLSGRDIACEDRRVVVRRNIKTSGRSSIYIQDAAVSRSDLEQFMGFLFDLHGQHSHESLLCKENHRIYLDRFAGLEDEAVRFNRMFMDLAEKKKTLEKSAANERDRDSRLEILRYNIAEIDKAAVKAGEGRELEAESGRLSSFEKLAAQVNAAFEVLFADEPSALSLIRRVRSSLENAAAIDGELLATQQRMADLYYEAEDLAEELRSYRDALRYEPGRLEEVEERLALLYRLRKKYSASPAAEDAGEEGVLGYRAAAEAEIEALSGAAENREKLTAEIAALEKDLAVRATVLGTKRRAAAARLGERIGSILKNLGMANARFAVTLKPRGQAAAESPAAAQDSRRGSLVIGPWGAEEAEFLISANAGEPLKDLSRIASGGELSRVMLAIKTALTGDGADGGDARETLVFDEIDTGIGGEVALTVGDYLKKIGEFKQIFCVTHLASIAVRADNHLMVTKKTGGGRTTTAIAALAGEDLRREIARMLAGDAGGAAALAHADELLKKHRK